MAAQQVGGDEIVVRLMARLDAQEAELAGLRAEMRRPATNSAPVPTSRRTAVRESVRPSLRPSPDTTRRTLLKGAGAILFTTALLATGEVVPITPFQVAAADPAPRPNGAPSSSVTPLDTLYQTFLGTDFQPETTADGYTAPFGAGEVYQSLGIAANFSARVDLPQGATTTEVIFWVLRNDANVMTVDMASSNPVTGGFFVATGTVPLSGSVEQAISLSIGPTTVDNSTYSYVLEWRPGTVGSTQRLYGARVGYTLPSNAQVYGNALAGIGVLGQSASGTGVKGIIPGGSAAGTIAVYGSNNASAASSHGIVGIAGSGHGLVGSTNFTGGGPPYYAGLVGNAPNGAYAGLFFGNVSIAGTLNGHTAIVQQAQIAVAHADGTHRLANGIGAVELWLEDAGKGTLTNGQTTVKIDPAFAALADTAEYQVFLTAHGDFNLHVAEMKPDGFVVRVTSAGGDTQSAGGAPVGVSQVAKAGGVTGTFSWRVTAKRKDGQAARLAAYTFPNIQAPHIPDPPKAAETKTKP